MIEMKYLHDGLAREISTHGMIFSEFAVCFKNVKIHFFQINCFEGFVLNIFSVL